VWRRGSTHSQQSSYSLAPDGGLPPCDGRLYVTVLDCSDLLPADSDNSSDPQVKLTFGHGSKQQSHKTKTVLKSLNPQYNQQFEFTVIGARSARDCELTLSVWDEDLIVRGKGLKQDFIGQVTIDLCRHFSGGWNSRTVNDSFALEDPKGEVTDKNATAELGRRTHQRRYGSIRIEVNFVGVEQTDGAFASSMNATGTWRVCGTGRRYSDKDTAAVNSWIVPPAFIFSQ
jgi:hypothetical protein